MLDGTDIALIKLKQPVKLSSKVNVVCLPFAKERLEAGRECVVAGWGMTSSLSIAIICLCSVIMYYEVTLQFIHVNGVIIFKLFM